MFDNREVMRLTNISSPIHSCVPWPTAVLQSRTETPRSFCRGTIVPRHEPSLICR